MELVIVTVDKDEDNGGTKASCSESEERSFFLSVIIMYFSNGNSC